ncbi:ATP-binding protein [Ectobacillus funiculus]|uniref:ATP-binding protein n=1 Tax=Ectobacillus funiculus TaxID=137993 RepID=UPI003CCC54EB
MNNHTNMNHPIDHSAASQDTVILEHYGLNELNFESVKGYREKFAMTKPNHPWNGLETKEFLYKIGAWGKLRNTSKEGLTVAGLLMFSEERIITEVFPQYFLEYRESLQDTLSSCWSERFTSQDGTWSGNLYDFYFKVMEHFSKGLPVSYMKEKICLALHEALINMIVHADYYVEGGLVIERNAHAIRFSNPGLFRIPVEQAFEGGISNLRNPNVFKMFILIDLCQRAGFGLKSMYSLWTEQQWSRPHIDQEAQLERTTLTLSMSESIAEGKLEWMDEIASTYDGFEIDRSSVNKEYSSMNSEVDSVNKEYNSVNNDSNSVNKEQNSISIEDNSVNNDVDSMNNDSNSMNKEYSSVNNEEDDPILEELPTFLEQIENIDGQQESVIAEDIEKELWEISEIARRKKRLSPSKMEEIILQLLMKKPLMLKELSRLLERTSDGLRNNYLAKLLQKEKIKLKYPDQPNHPKQAYLFRDR